MIDKFSDRFCHCNPKLGLDKGKNLMGIVIYMTKWVLILYFSVVVDENGQGYFSSQYELVPSECKLNLVKGSLGISSFNVPHNVTVLVIHAFCSLSHPFYAFFRHSVCFMLLPDHAVCRPQQPCSEKQNVQERVHQEHPPSGAERGR